MRLFLLGCFLLTLSKTVIALPADSFIGTWQGQTQDGSGPVALELSKSGETFSLEIRSDQINWPESQFKIGSNPGLYEGDVSSGMLDWLSLGSDPGPLRGKTLLWARESQDGSLIAYRFQIQETGDFSLQRAALFLTNGRLLLQYEPHDSDGMAGLIAVELEKS